MKHRGFKFYTHIFVNFLFISSDINGQESWKIIFRLSNKIIDPAYRLSTQTVESFPSCAFRCQLTINCDLFQFNGDNLCETYGKTTNGFLGSGSAPGNRFYQLMPKECVSGLDEWLPDNKKCIWIPNNYLNADDAKQHCLTRSKLLPSVETQQKYDSITNLIRLLGINKMHVYSERLWSKTFQWSNGQLVMDHWCPGEPSGDGSCLEILVYGWFCSNGGLNDLACYEKNWYFCE